MLVFLAIGLTLDAKLLPSPLIGKPIPSFSATLVKDPQKIVRTEDLKGEPFIFNVWASWCAACKEEHSTLLEIAEEKKITIIGLNYKDAREDSINWLNNYGNPYEFSLYDWEGKLGMDLGVYGVPETFLVDEEGMIIYKHVGPINRKIYRDDIMTRVLAKNK